MNHDTLNDPLAPIPESEQTDDDKARIAAYRAAGLHGRLSHRDRCADCGALLPADDWSSVVCEHCPGSERETLTIDGTVANWDTFWREVARLHRMYGTLEDPS